MQIQKQKPSIIPYIETHNLNVINNINIIIKY